MNNFWLRNSRAQLVKISKAIILVVLIYESAQAGEIKVYGAASLTDVLKEISDGYQKSHQSIIIKTSYAGSSTLAKQIENGAPVDIFISADNDWMDYLQKRDLIINESRKKLVGNDLVVIAPMASNLKISLDPGFNFSDSFGGRLCTGDTSSVPVGKYAKQSLISYNWWEKISGRVVGSEDVRTALTFVERAECDLGIVYKTDAKLSKKVKIVATFPAASHAPIEYPGALTKNAGAEAKMFWSYLQSDDAKKIFSHYGFIAVN